MNVWIWCSGTLLYFPHVRKGKRTTRDCLKVEEEPSVQLYSGSVLIAPIGGNFARRSCDAQY